MNRLSFKNLASGLALLLLLVSASFGQTTTPQTHITAAVTSTETSVSVKSATNVAAGNILFVDKEAMRVLSISGTTARVARGTDGTLATSHAANSIALTGPVGQGGPFIFNDRPVGASVTAASQRYLPQISVKTGKAFTVIGGRWYQGSLATLGTNYGLSPAIWGDCPLDGMVVDPAYGTVVGDEFLEHANTTAHRYELTGANGTFTAGTGVAHGTAVLTAPATDNNEAYLASHNDVSGLIKADATSNWWFEARVKINQITTAQGVFVGLGEETGIAVDFMTDDTMALKVVDYLGFQILAATDIAAVWQTVFALNGGARVAVSATAGTAGTAYTKLGMKSIAGTVTFYIDGAPLATGTTSAATNFPLDQVMEAVFATKVGSAAANTLTIDWWKAAQTRLAN